jgi:hypothetical protein
VRSLYPRNPEGVGKRSVFASLRSGWCEKKQWYRKLPSRRKWHSASARCQMNRNRRVPEDEDGRNLREATYAAKTMARVDRREMMVVWSNRSGGRDDAVSVAIVIDPGVVLFQLIN